jgi:hypothetical protein
MKSIIGISNNFNLHAGWRNSFLGVSSWAPQTFKNTGSELEFMGARNRVGIGLSYRPARLYRLAELIPWKVGMVHQLVFLNVYGAPELIPWNEFRQSM